MSVEEATCCLKIVPCVSQKAVYWAGATVWFLKRPGGSGAGHAGRGGGEPCWGGRRKSPSQVFLSHIYPVSTFVSHHDWWRMACTSGWMSGSSHLRGSISHTHTAAAKSPAIKLCGRNESLFQIKILAFTWIQEQLMPTKAVCLLLFHFVLRV